MTRLEKPLFVTIAFVTLFAASCSDEEALAPSPQESVDAGPTVDELRANIEDLERQVAEKESTLAELREENQKLEARLPEPHQVERGESHWEIAYRFLTEERGLDPDEARRRLTDAALLHPIVEGFQIWNFYNGQEFGSFATQDEAQVSPGALMRAEAEDAEDERMRLASQVAELKRELDTQQARLDRRIAHLESQVSTKAEEVTSLRDYIETLRGHQDNLRSRIARLEEYSSSVYYIAGTDAGLRAENKVTGSFLTGGSRLGELRSQDFERRIDLRETSSIELRAEDLDISRIDDVELLPGDWEVDTHYRISVADDGRTATLDLLDEDRFRLKTLVILVSS